jgi:hypothetical protein
MEVIGVLIERYEEEHVPELTEEWIVSMMVQPKRARGESHVQHRH